MNSPAKRFLVFAACSGAVAVGLGAFGAHVLEDRLAEGMMAIYRTGVEYHFYHALGLLLVGIISSHAPSKQLKWSALLLGLGIILFSGSLYVLAVSGIRWIGAITPVGGISFIAGWVMLFVAIRKK